MEIKCSVRRCKGEMIPGKAIQETYISHSDFIGEPPVVGCTMSTGGTGKPVDVLKCTKCGHSFTFNGGQS